MKLVSYLRDGQDQLAILINGLLYNADELHPNLPGSMGMFLNYWDDAFPLAQQAEEAILQGRFLQNRGIPEKNVSILSPVPFPTSCRDGYSFKQHIETVRKNLGRPIREEFNQYPVFYFSNQHSVKGPGEIYCMPDHFEKLDFELEAAIVICRHGRNIPAKHADQYIGGLMIMNDISARTLQAEEMLLNLGPAKGKDFATTLGPVLVTLDELEGFEIPPKVNHVGKCWNLTMTCRVNGVQVSAGNIGDMDWTFAELIERASYGVDIYPGDIIGSGTVGTGCFLELNGSARLANPAHEEQWLKAGDLVEMEMDGIGILHNTFVAEETDWSILKQRKQ